MVVATPWDSAVRHRQARWPPALAGKVVVSMANALVKEGREFLALVPPRGSVAAAVQAALPGSLVSAAFHHLPASEMEKLTTPLVADVLVCSDHPEATEATVALVDRDRRPAGLDAGSLAQAAPIEAFTAVLHHHQHPPQGARRRAAGRLGPAESGTVEADRVDADDAALRHGPAARWSPSSRGRWSRCTPAASRPTTRPTSGHAQVYLTFDILQRRLRDLGHETRCVRNVTDVDDDILRKARELGVHYLDLAAEEIARFDADMAALGLLPAYSEPRATSAIPDILTLIGAVLDSGHAYQSGGAVYFDVTTFAALRPGQPLRRGRPCWPWPPSTAGTPTTPTSATRSTSCCGSPRCPTSRRGSRGGARAGPGWHIECSALALRELGETLDVHGGGRDLVFPHHECETAQSESVTGRPVRRATGSTSGWSAWTAPRCPSRSATWSSWATC